jgi:hypothetical protein
VATLANGNNFSYLYTYGLETLILSSFIVFWGASHLVEDWKGRVTWPFLIFVLGVANFSSIIMVYFTPSNILGSFAPNSPLLNVTLAITPGPLLVIVGGILGFFAVRQYSREHGHAVIGHALSTK